MRTITGYRDGKAIWSDNEPARARIEGGSINGSAVTAVPSAPKKHDPAGDYQRAYRAAKRAKGLLTS